MKKIDLDNAMLIYDDGELVAMYEVKKTKADIAKALKDCGYFDDIDEDEWEIGIGDAECHSIDDIAADILENNVFTDDTKEFDIFLGVENTPDFN